MRTILWWWVLLCAVGCQRANVDATLDVDGGVSVNELSALEAATGSTWQMRRRDDGTVALLAGKTSPLALSPSTAERAARGFLGQWGALFSLGSIDELDTASSELDGLGMLHVRFTQVAGKIPVWGTELRVHFDRQGALVSVAGNYRPLGDVALVPVVSAGESETVALASAQAQLASPSPLPSVDPSELSTLTPQLWVYPATTPRLAWLVEVTVADLVRPARLQIFVDALDGQVLSVTDRYAHVTGSGVGVFGDAQSVEVAERSDAYWLEDATRSLKSYSMARRTRLPGGEVESSRVDAWDQNGPGAGSAVDAAAYVADAYDYFLRVHGRRGWDGAGGSLELSVHFGRQLADAFFDGRGLVFGDGNGPILPLAGARDLVTHEYVHAVIDATSGLARDGQSGALAEAIADLFAVFATYDAAPSQRWRIGAVVFPDGPIRDLSNPHATHDPSTLDELTPGMDVHVASTVASHAGYVMAQSLGVGATEQIWYRALRYYLTQRADFSDGADATRAAAADLNPAWVSAVAQAWAAAGINP